MSPTYNSDFIEVGYQPGEKVANALRLLSFGVVMLVVSAWARKNNTARHPLHFLSWIGAAFYIGSQQLMSLFVLNCWQCIQIAPLIYVLKFIELLGLNLNSVAGCCMQVAIYRIVRSYRSTKRVKASSELPAVGVGVVIALFATLSSCVFWNMLLVTGGYFWVSSSSSHSRAHWINLSFVAVQAVIGLLQLLCLLLSFFHWSDFRGCMRSSGAFRSHVFVAGVTMISFLFSGLAGALDETSYEHGTELVMGSWCAKFVCMTLQTALLLNFEDLQTTPVSMIASSMADQTAGVIKRHTTLRKQGCVSVSCTSSGHNNTSQPTSGYDDNVDVSADVGRRQSTRAQSGTTSPGRKSTEKQRLNRIVPLQPGGLTSIVSQEGLL